MFDDEFKKKKNITLVCICMERIIYLIKKILQKCNEYNRVHRNKNFGIRNICPETLSGTTSF